jgi:hypothetical protein
MVGGDIARNFLFHCYSRAKKMMHRVWEYFAARLAFTMAAFNVLVQWHGLPAD